MKRTTKIAAGASTAAVAALVFGGIMQANAAEAKPVAADTAAPAAVQVENKTFTGVSKPGGTTPEGEEARSFARNAMIRYESENNAVCYDSSQTSGPRPGGTYTFTYFARCEKGAAINRVFSAYDRGADIYDANNKAKAAAVVKLRSDEQVTDRTCTEAKTDFIRVYSAQNLALARVYARCVPNS